MFVNLVSPSGTTLGQHRTRVSAQMPAHRHATCSGSVPGAVFCPSISSAMAMWGKQGHDSPCSPFLSHYFFSHMQTLQRACTSSAETAFCPTAAAHHRSNHIHFWDSSATSALALSWCLFPGNTVTKYLAPPLLMLQLHFRPEVPVLLTTSRTEETWWWTTPWGILSWTCLST